MFHLKQLWGSVFYNSSAHWKDKMKGRGRQTYKKKMQQEMCNYIWYQGVDTTEHAGAWFNTEKNFSMKNDLKTLFRDYNT